MDVLLIILGVAIAGFVLYWLLIGVGIAGIAIWALFPVLIGLVGGIWLWIAGHDNIGALVGVAGVVGQIVWMNRMDTGGGSTYDPMSGKTKVYDKSGKVVGHHDKD